MNKMQVLIIDDDKDTANFFRLVLELVGFECEIVNSAKHALARLAASQPDLILLDMRLGLEIGGEDILYQIRSNPRLDRTRVIIITAYPTMAEPVSNLADLILLKPVDVEQLRTLTSRLMLRNTGTKRIEFRDPVTDLYNREFFVTPDRTCL
ncbi:MAG: response regulator [Anaerolineales bacterium]|nr:response regulator [Anaerolineales bacterium]